MHKIRTILMIAAVVGLVSCQAGAPKPVEIVLNEEACSHCQMAVSQRDFAAEVVFAGGAAEYFDDIGCLIRWVKVHIPEKAGIFVIDKVSGEWFDGNTAHYVRSARFHSPMSYGILAFKNSGDAEAAVKENEAVLLTWEELLAEDLS
jgi:copper chaperone NosL